VERIDAKPPLGWTLAYAVVLSTYSIRAPCSSTPRAFDPNQYPSEQSERRTHQMKNRIGNLNIGTRYITSVEWANGEKSLTQWVKKSKTTSTNQYGNIYRHDRRKSVEIILNEPAVEADNKIH